jgi:outer membrane protein TolC
MLKYAKIIIALVLFGNVIMLSAQAEEALTWQECLVETKRNHPDLISAQEKLNQAKADKAINRSSILPQVSTEASEKTSKKGSADEADTYSYSITGKQLIFDGFKTINAINAASEKIKSAQYEYEAISSDVRLDLKTAFIELLKAQELVDITKEIASRRRKNVELVNLRYEAGREHKGSLLNAQANLAQAEFEVSQAKRNIELKQRQLIKELGRENFSPIKVKGQLEVELKEQTKPNLEFLAESNPLLQEFITKKEIARFNLKSQQAEFFPEINVNASAGKSDSQWPPEEDQWSAGISVSFPIFEGGSRLAEVSKAKAELNQAQADQISKRDIVVFALEQAWKEWQDAIDKVTVEQQFLNAAEERARIAQSQYSTGLVSFDDWSIIEDNLVSAKKSLLTAKADALIAEASWIQAKGGTLNYVKK